MLPLSKPDKDSLLMDSFRPINNLPTIEKSTEQYNIEHMVEFLNENEIIHQNHHGSRAHHSPLTALTDIHSVIKKNYDKKTNYSNSPD